MRALAAAALAGVAIIGPLASPAGADGCNDIEVVFARGTGEAPGIGRVGQAFVDSLRGKVGNRSIGTYGVNYPATYDFPGGRRRRQRRQHLHPERRQQLSGHPTGPRRLLAGAAIIDVITSVPFPAVGFTNPLPANVPDRVARWPCSATRRPRSGFR